MSGSDLVPGPCWNQNRIAGRDGLRLPVDFHHSRSLQEKIKFLACLVVVALGRNPLWNDGFGEALIFDRGIRPVQNAAN